MYNFYIKLLCIIYDYYNKENEEIINNVIDSINEFPLNNFDQNESPILLSDIKSTYQKFYKHFEQHQAIQFKCENCLNFVRRDQVTLNFVKVENNNCYVDVHEFKEFLECNLFINGKFVSQN